MRPSVLYDADHVLPSLSWAGQGMLPNKGGVLPNKAVHVAEVAQTKKQCCPTCPCKYLLGTRVSCKDLHVPCKDLRVFCSVLVGFLVVCLVVAENSKVNLL